MWFFLTLVYLLREVHAWSYTGHRAIAEIADYLLSDSTREKMSNLLGDQPLSWYAPLPDDWDHQPKNAWAKPCHFLDMGYDELETATDSESGYNVLKCLKENVDNLRTRDMDCSNAPGSSVGVPQCENLPSIPPFKGDGYPLPCDLEFISHYIGDIHQPQHVRPDDGTKGGNNIKVKISVAGVKANNLHQLWDSGLLRKAFCRFDDLTNDLISTLENDPSLSDRYTADMDPVVWAQESWNISTNDDYQTDSSGRAIIDKAYYNKNIEIIKQRLLAGGIRLGTLLNSIYDGKSSVLPAAFASNEASFRHVFATRVPSPLRHDILTSPALFSTKTNQKAYRVLATAKIAEVKVDLPEFIPGVTDRSPQWTALFPFSQDFGLVTPQRIGISGPNEVARYVASISKIAKSQLLGSNPLEEGQIGTYLSLADSVEKNYAPLVYPIMGRAAWDVPAATSALDYFKQFLHQLNTTLAAKTEKFLLSHQSISLADISLASSLLPLYKFVFDPAFRAPYIRANQWFNDVVTSEAYLSVLRDREPTLVDGNKFKYCSQAPVIGSTSAEGDYEKAKKSAAFSAVDENIKRNSIVGLGSGSTVVYAAERLGTLQQQGFNLTAVPSSFQAQQLIVQYGLTLSDLTRSPKVDVDIDGADNIDKFLNMIKGGGGAMVQEKILATAAGKLVIISDDRKLSDYLGQKPNSRPYDGGVPIEVLPEAYVTVGLKIKEELQGNPTLRMGKAKAGPVVTDNGNFILDVEFPWTKLRPQDLQDLENSLKTIPGIVGTGFFLQMADLVYVGYSNGSVHKLDRQTDLKTDIPVIRRENVSTDTTSTKPPPKPTTKPTKPNYPASNYGSFISSTIEANSSNIQIIKTLEDLVLALPKNWDGFPLRNYLFQQVDLTDVDVARFIKMKFDGALFFGCTFPAPVGSLNLEIYIAEAGAFVVNNPTDLPFKPFRSEMYRINELRADDEAIYKWYKNSDIQKNPIHRLYSSLHDHYILEALHTYTTGKMLVGVMGGHAMLRNSSDFLAIAQVCRKLAKHGFVVVSGGGPGAMEAANLGAYFAQSKFKEDELEKAWKMLQVGDEDYKNEYDNYKSADAVIKRYGLPDDALSLGVATWVYGHEPFNRFTAWNAKLFSNAIREDILLQILNLGTIYAPGSGGTRQEIWQDATANSYADEVNTFSRPMIFFSNFWEKNNMYQTIYSIAKQEDIQRNKLNGWHTRIYSNLKESEIVDVLVDYSEQVVARFGDSAYRKEEQRAATNESVSGRPSKCKTKTNKDFADQEFAVKDGQLHDHVKPAERFAYTEVPLSSIDFRYLVVQTVESLYTQAEQILQQQTQSDFISRERAPLLTYKSFSELFNSVIQQGTKLVQTFPQTKTYETDMRQVLTELENKNEAVLLLKLNKRAIEIHIAYFKLKTHNLNVRAQLVAENTTEVAVLLSGILGSQWDTAISRDHNSKKFFALVSTLLSDLRYRNSSLQELTSEQLTSLRVAYTLLDQGARLPTNYRSLGLPGFRPQTQTYIFVTDPGPDNIRITSTNSKLLDGVTVHTEYIDRDNVANKALVESYRLPAYIWASRVRLHVGDAAPCSCYIGRPVFEGLKWDEDLNPKEGGVDLFSIDLLKTVHLTAGAASTMFSNGIADAKIAIEKMTDEQSITFLRSVVGNTFRDKYRQGFAAAFNLFTPITLKNGTVVGKIDTSAERLKLARLAIHIAKEGGVEKVTWDGASNKVPSDPILGLLKFEELVDLVHEAHQVGLITYISAGMEDKQVPDAVYTGVDGIGIGTSLHYLDPKTKVMGALREESIVRTLTARNTAASSIRGQAAALLARLDYKYFEGTIEEEEENIRIPLYNAVRNKDEEKLKKFVKTADATLHESFSGTGHRLLDRAQRLLLARKPLIQKGVAPKKWENAKKLIQQYLHDSDLNSLEEIIETLRSPNVARAEIPAYPTQPTYHTHDDL